MRSALVSRRSRLLAAAAVAVVLATGCFGGGGGRVQSFPSGTSYEQRAERDLFNLVNRDRTRAGLPALAWDDRLGGLALEWSHQMAATRNFSHRNLGAALGELPGFTRLAENILVGQCGMTGAEMHQAWMNSSGHRANIMSGSYNAIGIGVVCSSDGRVWATEDFGRR